MCREYDTAEFSALNGPSISVLLFPISVNTMEKRTERLLKPEVVNDYKETIF